MENASGAGADAPPPPKPSLLARVLISNALVLLVAGAILLLSPATISSPAALREIGILVAGLFGVLAANILILRRAFEPLERLTQAMSRVEPVMNTSRLPVYGDDREVIALTRAFNEMIDRLHRERRDSVRRSLQAQEGERQRVAQELHDEIGQTLTAMLLQIERANRAGPDELPRRHDELRESVRTSLDDVRRIAQRLRPELLDDLGLPSAMRALAERVSEQTGLAIDTEIESDLPELDEETELVLYRVAQEALTNTLRHASAQRVTLAVRAADGTLRLDVVDDGVGMNGARPGAGIAGMRERALLIGGRLDVRTPPGGGTAVGLEIPGRQER